VRSLKAFLLGMLAIGVVAYTAAAALAVAAQAGGHPLDIAFGPIRVVTVEDQAGVTTTTFGPGLLLIALAGGVANLALAAFIRRRAEREADGVD
jgi:hypothetical protein